MYSELPQTKIACEPLTWGYESRQSSPRYSSRFNRRAPRTRPNLRRESVEGGLRETERECDLKPGQKRSTNYKRSTSRSLSPSRHREVKKCLKGHRSSGGRRRSYSSSGSDCSTVETERSGRYQSTSGGSKRKLVKSDLHTAKSRKSGEFSGTSPGSSYRSSHESKRQASSRRHLLEDMPYLPEDLRKTSESSDSEEEYRRSRSRERHRINQQYLTIQRFCKSSTDDSQVFWDGFQWVKKGKGAPCYDQLMNATRRARRLHVGNLPLNLNVTEEQFQHHLWSAMIARNLCQISETCPIVHVWFAKDRGGNFGFMEMATVEQAIAALQLDGLLWHDVSISINRPTDWKRAINDQAIRLLAGTSGLAVAESVAAASQQAMMTGNSSGLESVLSNLPEEHRKRVTEIIKTQNINGIFCDPYQPSGLPVQMVQNKIRAELLKGCPSRVVKVSRFSPKAKMEGENEYKEILEDVMDECSKHGGVIRALIILPSLSLNVKVEVGDIFLEFAGVNQADNCILNLCGRMYEGHPIQMSRFNESLWQQHLKHHSENILLKSFSVS